jgi:outer membrane protein OmpA-like peptidoglycan-associated protein
MATLTARGRQNVGETATTSTKMRYMRIEVNGYTDISGTPHAAADPAASPDRPVGGTPRGD